MPAGVIVLVSGLGALYYCVRTTGTIELPYQVYIREYKTHRHFIPMRLPPNVITVTMYFERWHGYFVPSTWKRDQNVALSSVTLSAQQPGGRSIAGLF